MDKQIEVNIPPQDLNKLLQENGSSYQKEKNNLEVTGEQLLRMKVQQMEYLLEPILPRTGVAALAGASDTGKSMLLRHLAISVVGGESEFIGFRFNTKHRSCVYVSSEDGKDATAYLLRKQASQYLPAELNRLRFIFDYENLLEHLDKSLTHSPADLVIIDCFSDVFGQDLKDSQRIRTFLNPYHQLAEKHQCLVLFLHHTGKRTEHLEPSKNNLLSGQGLEAKMRLVIELRVDASNPNLRHLCIVKGNYLPADYKRESFVLAFDEQYFTFANTGDRTPFELLAKNPNKENDRIKYEQAKELKAEGHNYDEIAKRLGYANKGSVSKLFIRGKENGWGNA